ncbi:MAG TPA: MotA/TolQ/ExbB proton channel family protein [Myxococcota bacterium]|nr:MotA/TolQ/ExbB proton channel family protein [Myxococcota bacterium]
MDLFVGAVWGGRLASLNPLALIAQASWVVQLVMLLLAAFSILSWAAIVFKWRELRGASEDDEAFLEVFHEGTYEQAYRAAHDCDRGPLPAIFLAAHAERVQMQKYAGRKPDAPLDESQVERIARRIRWAASEEGRRLESRLGLLATTGSSTPFIGLFGTVIGIMDAFENIGQAGSASLAVVAPGIAEALIATAIGLFAAIPATIFYNIFVARLREIEASIDLFTHELEEDLRRESAQAAPVARAAGV